MRCEAEELVWRKEQTANSEQQTAKYGLSAANRSLCCSLFAVCCLLFELFAENHPITVGSGHEKKQR
jgi:hypothetical protein